MKGLFILAGLRRVLSLASAKANSSCLNDLVFKMGEATRLAAKRRAWVKREEDRLKREGRSYWHANLGERGTRGGQLRIN